MGEGPDKPDRSTSPYPLGRAARIAAPANGKLSAVLVARPMACLIVRVTFHKDPCVGLEVKFSKATDDGKPGEAIGDKVKTNKRGIAGVEFMVPAGLYACEIQNQHPTLVSTVPDLSKPYAVVTPIDRPYFDVGEEHEWDDEDTTDDDDDDDDDEGSAGP